MTDIGPADLRGMFDQMTSSAFRLEARSSYALDYEAPNLAAFLRGQPQPPAELDFFRPWIERVARLTASGRRIQRVRTMDTPAPSDYQRWNAWVGQWNCAAGEDIRYLSRDQLAPRPATDWWLFDDERVVLMEFDDDGHLIHRELLTGAAVNRYIEWRDDLWAAAHRLDGMAA